MFGKIRNGYIIVSISIAIFLFGLAIILNFFLENFLAILLTAIGCIIVWICAFYIVDYQVAPLSFTNKGFILVTAVFLALYSYLVAILLYFQLNSLSAILTAHGIWICLALTLSYFLIENIEPLRKTPKEELFILLIIIIIGLILILTLTLNNLIITFLIVGTCIMVYLFWVIVLSKIKPPSKRIID